MRKTTPLDRAAPPNQLMANMHRWKFSALAAAAVLCVGLHAGEASALALGRITVQSALGEPLRAEIDVPQITAAEAETLRATAASPEVFRSQGMEFNPLMNALQIQLQRRADGSAVLRVSSDRPVNDPFLDLVLDTTWGTGKIVRSYTLLLDPPALRSAPPTATAAPQITAPAVAQQRPAPAPAGCLNPVMPQKLRAIIVGAGHRSIVYASYALQHPDELEIVGVVDPSEPRRRQAARIHHLAPEQCHASVEELVARPKHADFVINGTMDLLHVPTSLPVLAAGYDLLLEKPIATSEAELGQLVQAARRHGRRVCICHVLRYTPFYAAIRHEVIRGTIGRLLSVQAVEHVSYHHHAVGFVRGKWNRRDGSGSTMLMAKSCHDLDLIAWMKSGVAPVRVSSFGGNLQFRPDQAPAGAGTRCLVDS